MSYDRPTSHGRPAVAGRDVPTTWSNSSGNRVNLFSCARHRRLILLGSVSNALRTGHLDILDAKKAEDGLQVGREVSRAARGWSEAGARLPPPKLLPVSVAGRSAGGWPGYLARGTVRAPCSVASRRPKGLQTVRKAQTLLITPSIPAVHPLPLVQRDHVVAISQSGSNVANSNRLPSVDDETRSIANLLRSDLQKAD